MQVAGAAQLRLLWALGSGEGAVNVLGLVVTGNPVFDQTFANTVGAAVKSACTTTWASSLATNVSLARVGLRDLRTDDQPEFRDTGAVVVGTATGDILPRAASVLITLRTAKAGKSFRGRVYLPGASELNNDTVGLGTSTINTAGVAFINAVNSAITSSGIVLGVLSRPAEQQTLVETTFHADGTTTARTLSRTTAKSGQVNRVTSVEARDTRWQYQRRRDNGRTLAPALFSGPVAIALLP